MKLRNKNTGEIVDTNYIEIRRSSFTLKKPSGETILEDVKLLPLVYDSIADLNKDWEDYKPAKPLIKDEKVRKAVRAWAEVNGLFDVDYDDTQNAFIRFDFIICFDYFFDEHDGLEAGRTYTIAELCGEEEE